MEAPEKVWINKDHAVYFQPPKSGEYLEYTRTDAFIEKAEDYLNSKLYDWVSITNPDQRSCTNVIPKKDFIDDFKNYMKGE